MSEPLDVTNPCWTGNGSEMDHDWKFQDDSFDHEFGCEQVHYWLCERCEATRDMEPARTTTLTMIIGVER